MDCASGAVRWKARKRLTKPVVSDRRTWHVRGRRRPRTRSDCILAPTKAAEGRRTPGRWRAASQAGRRRCVWMRGGLPKNARSPKPKTSGIGRGRARAGPGVYPAVFPVGLEVRYKSFTTPRNKIIPLRSSTMPNRKGRSTIISNGLGGFISIPALAENIPVTAAASVPSSPTSTKAF